MNEFIKYIKELLFYKKLSFRVSLAIKIADYKQKAFNKQYFVILSDSDKLIAINNTEVERMKRTPRYSRKMIKAIAEKLYNDANKYLDSLSPEVRKRRENDTYTTVRNTIKLFKKYKLLPKNLDGQKLRKTCFYYTPYSANNKMTAEEKEEARIRYITYMKKYHF